MINDKFNVKNISLSLKMLTILNEIKFRQLFRGKLYSRTWIGIFNLFDTIPNPQLIIPLKLDEMKKLRSD